jgi:hypothetical protein
VKSKVVVMEAVGVTGVHVGKFDDPPVPVLELALVVAVVLVVPVVAMVPVPVACVVPEVTVVPAEPPWPPAPLPPPPPPPQPMADAMSATNEVPAIVATRRIIMVPSATLGYER